MNPNAYKIVGIQTVERNGKISNTIYFTSAFSEYEKDNSLRCEGVKVDSEWTSMDCSSLAVGDVAELLYSKGYKGAARLTGFRVLKNATTPAKSQ